MRVQQPRSDLQNHLLFPIVSYNDYAHKCFCHLVKKKI